MQLKKILVTLHRSILILIMGMHPSGYECTLPILINDLHRNDVLVVYNIILYYLNLKGKEMRMMIMMVMVTTVIRGMIMMMATMMIMMMMVMLTTMIMMVPMTKMQIKMMTKE